MDVTCPNCTQRLRYADHLQNPLLRCGNCRMTFRPSEVAAAADEYVSAVAVADDPPLPSVRPEIRPVGPIRIERAPSPSPTSARESYSFGSKGLGTFGVIALLLAVKFVPRIMREVLRERKPDAVPVQMRNEDRQAVEQLLRDARKNAGARRDDLRLPQPEPLNGRTPERPAFAPPAFDESP